MKTSEVFRKVKAHLRDEGHMMSHERYICYALSRLYLCHSIGDRDRTRCKRLIRVHLEGYASLEHWLYANHHIPTTNTPAYKKKIMATRKAWLDHLIAHYESKGE